MKKLIKKKSKKALNIIYAYESQAHKNTAQCPGNYEKQGCFASTDRACDASGCD